MIIALDTNILLRYVEPTSHHYGIIVSCLAILQASRCEMRIFPQNIYEFWATGTRPLAANGLGFSSSECLGKLKTLKQLFPLISDDPTLLSQWEDLVVNYQCTGKVSYDARIVAAMQTHNIQQLLTFNITDFQRFTNIHVIDPQTIAASGRIQP